MEKLSAREAARISDEVEAQAFIAMWDAAPAGLRERLGLRIERVADATLLLAPGLPSPMFNRALGLGMRERAGIGDVQSIAGIYRQAGCKSWWLHWNPLAEPPGLAQEIEALGFMLPTRRSWAKMLRGPETLPEIATDLRIAPATAAQAAEVARIAVQAFEMPPFMVEWLQQLRTGPWRMYAVTEGDAVVGGGCLYLQGREAWLGVAAVAPSHRRRGGQGALMARRIADAAAGGAVHIVTETGEPTSAGEANPSLANMRRCGFTTVASRLNYASPG
jgi:hypothetical protein